MFNPKEQRLSVQFSLFYDSNIMEYFGDLSMNEDTMYQPKSISTRDTGHLHRIKERVFSKSTMQLNGYQTN